MSEKEKASLGELISILESFEDPRAKEVIRILKTMEKDPAAQEKLTDDNWVSEDLIYVLAGNPELIDLRIDEGETEARNLDPVIEERRQQLSQFWKKLNPTDLKLAPSVLDDMISASSHPTPRPKKPASHK